MQSACSRNIACSRLSMKGLNVTILCRGHQQDRKGEGAFGLQQPPPKDGCAMYHKVCYTCPSSGLPWVLRKVLRRSGNWAKAGACVANIVTPQDTQDGPQKFRIRWCQTFSTCSGRSTHAIPGSRAAADLEAEIIHFLPSRPQHLPVVLSRIEASDDVPRRAAPRFGTRFPYMA